MHTESVYPERLRWFQAQDDIDETYRRGTVFAIAPEAKPEVGELAAYQQGGGIHIERHQGQGGVVGAVVATRFGRG